MDSRYLAAEIMKGRRRTVHLFELEGDETLEEVVEKNFGKDVHIVSFRMPTPEELILMRRGMKT